MRKRRSTVYVRPGKDVTLYVPVETPQAVIDYLNHLKDEGMFSQGVMEILIRHVEQQGHKTMRPAANGDELAAPHRLPSFEPLENLEPVAAKAENDVHTDRAAVTISTPSKKLNLAQIFRQAQRNAGKLTDSRENN